MADSEQQPILNKEEEKKSRCKKKILIALCILVVFVSIGVLIAVVTTSTFVKSNDHKNGMSFFNRILLFQQKDLFSCYEFT